MGFFRYALMDVLRGRRRTFSSILGVLLAVAFLAGTFIAIDSSARATLEGLLEGVRGDFRVSGARGDPGQLRGDLEAVPGVVNTSVYSTLHFREVRSEGDRYAFDVQVYAVDPGSLPARFRDAQVAGSLDLPQGTVGLTQSLATTLDAKLGDTVSFVGGKYDPVEREYTTPLVNLTVSALLTETGAASARFGYEPPAALIHLRDLSWFVSQLGSVEDDGRLEAEVWIDRGRFIDPYDLDESHQRLGRLERELQLVVGPYGGFVRNNLSSALSSYQSSSQVQRIVFLLLSVPVLLLGLYLGAVGVDLGHAERRRELAVLKTRGAGRGQVVGLLLLGAVIGGLLAALLGLAAGVLLSRLLLAVVNPFALDVAATLGDLVLSRDTVLTVVLFSVLFMVLASYRSAKRTARLPVVETLRHYAPGETQIEYRPTVDLVLLTVGILTFTGVWYVRVVTGGFVTFLLGFVFIIMLPLAPIFLIVASTRLLTRSTGRVYELVSRLWRPIAKGLSSVISRNLARNPRRAANVAVIIALGMAFGMFIFAFFGSVQGYQVRIVRASVGADMAVLSPPVGDATFPENVTRVEGVVGVSPLASLGVDLFSFRSARAWAVDPDTLFEVTHPEPWHFEAFGVGEAARRLAVPGQVLVSRGLADRLFFEEGDSVELAVTYYNASSMLEERREVRVTVAGIVRALPGTEEGAFSRLPEALYGSFETLGPLLRPPADDVLGPPEEFRGVASKLLVDLEPGADWRAVKASVVGLGASSVRVVEEELERSQADPFFRSILGFISLEIAFIVVILTAGLGLILFAATLERDVEFASIRARGASGWQAAGLLMGEAFAIMIIGLAIGVGIGLLVAYALIQLIFFQPPGVSEPLVPLLFELPLEAWLLVGLAPLAMLLTALLVAWRIASMNVARVLKVRGG